MQGQMASCAVQVSSGVKVLLQICFLNLVMAKLRWLQAFSMLLVAFIREVVLQKTEATFSKEGAPVAASSEFTQHKIIIPRVFRGKDKREIFTTRQEGRVHFPDITVEVHLGNRNHTLELRLNTALLTSTFFHKHQENGTDKVHSPKKDEVELCQYKGYIKGVRHSWAAISSCEGFRGTVYDGTEVHYFEPASFYHENEFTHFHGRRFAFHYKHSHLNTTKIPCGSTETSKLCVNESCPSYRVKRATDPLQILRGNIHGPQEADEETRYVELLFVADHSEYLRLNSSKSKTFQRLTDIANVVNALYFSLNIFIALVGIIVWSEKDEIILREDSRGTTTTLYDFLAYRRSILQRHPNDNAHLVTGVKFQDRLGLAFLKTMCGFNASGGTSMDHSNVLGLVAATIAHEMGHNLGMRHDGSECVCPQQTCVMTSVLGTFIPSQWSDCSKDQLRRAFAEGVDHCLQNKPSGLFDDAVCGNGFVEGDEECDCGLKEVCRNPCCNVTTCKLHGNATCATGQCCNLKTCRPIERAFLCRHADRECDLPEFCDGESEYCPVDVFKMDGASCRDGAAFCVSGECRTHTDQCKTLWGPSATTCPLIAYESNKDGSDLGNCGYSLSTNTTIKCSREDVLCGALHCLLEPIQGNSERKIRSRSEFFRINRIQIQCHVTEQNFITDPGLAPDGSKCGEHKMCLNQRCVEVPAVDSCTENCNGQGVCNSRGHCHCNDGFGHPNCDTPGIGGSEDSGPVSNNISGQRYTTSLYILFLGIVPFSALAAILTPKVLKQWRAWRGKISVTRAHGPQQPV